MSIDIAVNISNRPSGLSPKNVCNITCNNCFNDIPDYGYSYCPMCSIKLSTVNKTSILKLRRNTKQQCKKCRYNVCKYGYRYCPNCSEEFDEFWWNKTFQYSLMMNQ
jgi:hypothetical protein